MDVTTQPESKNRRQLGGRPKLLPEERRSIQVKVGFTPAQAEKLAERAEQAGVSDVELIRRLALNQEINAIPSCNRDAIVELNRIGNNLNQIARGLNANAIKPMDSEASAAWFKKLQETIAQIGLRLTNGDQ